MKFGYAQPFSFAIGRGRPARPQSPRPQPLVSSVRHGVTEITLSDGRLVRATLHVRDVKTDPNKPGAVDVSYNIVAEIVNRPDVVIHAVHETIQ